VVVERHLRRITVNTSGTGRSKVALVSVAFSDGAVVNEWLERQPRRY
jgi:hypothetical protein